jgi:DNA helicase II / ATP-dependent DNA helicase PcrA
VSQIRLNENQKQAVKYNNGDLLIIAGAGTGKTAVLTQRIINIMKQGWAKPSEILALTFTEKAAQEMQDRVDLEMEYGYEEPAISTFHSFCDKILREDGYNIGLDGGYSLMSTTHAYVFLRRYFYDLPLKTLRPRGNSTKFINDLIRHFSRLQDEDVSAQEYLEYASTLPKKSKEEKEEYIRINELAQTYKKYSDLKMENSKVDFGDLIILTLKLFRERENILAKYRKRFKYILVDEFQDTNYTQNVLVNTLVLGNEEAKKKTKGNTKEKTKGKIKGEDEKKEKERRPLLTVVGDDDQAIYKFRGAAISNILQFKETYPDAREIVLIQNYRSRQEILDASYALIKHNNPNRLEVTEDIDKKLVAKAAFKKDENIVNLLVANNEMEEAEKVVSEILKLTGYEEYLVEGMETQSFDEKGQASFVKEQGGQYQFSDIAIFARANAHADAFIQALRNKGVPYKIGGSRGLYFREEIRNMIAFLRVLTDYSDEISMYRLTSMPIWGLTPREYVEINKRARSKNITLFEELEALWDIKLGEGDIKKGDLKNNVNEKLTSFLSPKAIAGLSLFLERLDISIKKVKDNRPVLEILYDFVTQSPYIKSFMEEESNENLFAVKNINKFFELVKKYEKDNRESNIYEYVDFLNYSIEIGESPLVDQLDMEELNAVNIMTVHGSKGLEFPVVFLVNLVAQRFPSTNRPDPIPISDELIKETMPYEVGDRELNIQEERRLFYVGATRAKEKLFLSAAYFYGDGKRKKRPSIFLNEILDRSVDEEFKESDADNLRSKELDMNIIDEESFNSIVKDPSKVNLAKRFSYSRLNLYEACPRKYEYAYILKVPQKPNAALSFGITVHNTLRDFYSLLKQSQMGLEGITKEPSKKELLELYEKNWVSMGYESSQQEKQRKEEGVGIMENYFDKVFHSKERPLRLEESFEVHIGDTVFVGKIDRIDLEKDKGERKEVTIVDYKTGREREAKDVKNDLQLPLYALFAQEKLGFNVVKAQYIYVETGKVLEVDISQERRELAKEKLLEVVELVRKGKFNPTPGYLCRYCDYNSICEYAEL